MNHLLEGTMIGILAVWTGTRTLASAISEGDWMKIKGPEGALFLSVVIIIVLWNAGRVREKNENTRRENEEKKRDDRHKEQLALQKDNADKLIQLNVESILAQGKATQAINSMDRTMQALTIEIKERPCQKSQTPQ